jgi:ligand-binding sensor domain-containing protein
LFLALHTLSTAQLYNFRNYSVEDGIAQSQVYSVIQDSRGLLWFGTRGGGITQYDGLNFKTFTEKDGLLNNYIYQIKEDSKKNLWIANNKGLSYYNGIRFTNFPLSKSKDIQVFALDIRNDKEIWLATSAGLYLFQDGKYKNISKELGIAEANVNAVYCAKNGEVFFGDAAGLYKVVIAGSNYFLKDLRSLSRFLKNSITSIKQDQEGALWIGTYGDGVYILKNNNVRRIDHQHELYKTTILDISFDAKGNLWFATLNDGVIQYDPSEKLFNKLSETEGLSNNHVRSIIQDNSGNFWFGTSGGGVCNYFGKQFTTYDKEAGLTGNFIYSIYRTSRGKLWVGNSHKGISYLEDGRFKNFNSTSGFLDVKVKAMVEDQHGNLFIGTEGKGVYVLVDSVFHEIAAFRNTYIRAMIRDKQNQLWIATAGNGVFRMEYISGEVKLKNLMVRDGLLSNRITTIVMDKNGAIWYGTENNGVGKIDSNGKVLGRYSVAQGLSSNMIRSLVTDASNNIWVGTAGSGLNVIQNDKVIRSYDYKNGLTSTNIYLLTIDLKGNLIIGTEKGLDYVFLNQFNFRGIKHYSKGDGFTGVETCTNAVFNDGDGSIWFGTINGLIKYNPAHQVQNSSAPILRVTDVKLYYNSISKTEFAEHAGDWNQIQSLALPSNQNHITFEFFGVNLSNSDAVQYQWKLEGFDDNWSPVSSDRSILYSNLNPGQYRFLVKACNEDGVWTAVPYSISFSIATPFWYQWWFILLVVLVLGGSSTLLIRYRISSIKRKADEEKEKIQMDKMILELEQRSLRLQMNPHFIFNAMNSIQSQIGTGNDKEARYYLAKFSRLMRQILDNSRKPLISLQEEIAILENYLLIEKFCNGDRFDYEIICDSQLETDFIQIPPMLLQPFVENAIKHGMKDLGGDKRGLIRIEFISENQQLVCIVEDNGIGRKKAEAIKQQSTVHEHEHASVAIKITRERLELMGAVNNDETLEIIDLYENGAPSGTRVIVRI